MGYKCQIGKNLIIPRVFRDISAASLIKFRGYCVSDIRLNCIWNQKSKQNFKKKYLNICTHIEADLDLWWPLVVGDPGHEVATSAVIRADLRCSPSSNSDTDPLGFRLLAKALLNDCFSWNIFTWKENSRVSLVNGTFQEFLFDGNKT